MYLLCLTLFFFSSCNQAIKSLHLIYGLLYLFPGNPLNSRFFLVSSAVQIVSFCSRPRDHIYRGLTLPLRQTQTLQEQGPSAFTCFPYSIRQFCSPTPTPFCSKLWIFFSVRKALISSVLFQNSTYYQVIASLKALPT